MSGSALIKHWPDHQQKRFLRGQWIRSWEKISLSWLSKVIVGWLAKYSFRKRRYLCLCSVSGVCVYAGCKPYSSGRSTGRDHLSRFRRFHGKRLSRTCSRMLGGMPPVKSNMCTRNNASVGRQPGAMDPSASRATELGQTVEAYADQKAFSSGMETRVPEGISH